LLRHHHPRLERSCGRPVTAPAAVCSAPAHREQRIRPRSGGARVEEQSRPEPESKVTSAPRESSTGPTWSDAPRDLDIEPAPVLAPTGRLMQDMASASERCPHCTRVFSKEAAARHVPICSQLRTRPKPPPMACKDSASTFTDSLGRRGQSRPGTAGRSTPGASPMNVSTPSRACRGSSKPSSRAGTPSSVRGRKLNMGEEFSEPGASGEAVTGPPNVLSEQWHTLQFMLRNGCDAFWDDAAIAKTSGALSDSLKFLESLEDWANRLKMRKGALSRMLLPFDSETDSNDQANSASLAPLGSRELNGLIPDDERKNLVTQVITLRRLIRVKVADCNDIEQAREALRLAANFMEGLKQKAGEEQRTMTSVLREL